MATANVLLAVVALGLVAVLVRAVRQNRALFRQVRASGRPMAPLLLDALVLWSPLAAVILVALLAAHAVTTWMVALVFRTTPIDAFCRVEGVATAIVVPCTGMDGTLPRAAVRRSDAVVEIDEFLSARHRQARQRAVRMSAGELRTAAIDRAAFARTFAPRTLLGLPPAPEEDAEVARLHAELRRLLANPPRPVADPIDALRFVAERNRYTTSLRAVTAQARARRRAVGEAAYAGLPREQAGRLYLAHRVSHLLAPVPSRLDAGSDAALARLRAGRGDEAADLARVRGGLAALLARNESAAADILATEARTPRGRRTLELVLAVPRRCTLASSDDVQAVADDLARGDASDLLPRNSGTFACFDFGDGASRALTPLGFRESVRRSIDRWYRQAVADSARRLGALSRGSVATQASASAIAAAVPRGIALGRAECGLLHPAGCAANAFRQAAEETLADAFAQVATPAEQGATRVANAAGDVDAALADTLGTLDARLARMRAVAHGKAAQLFLVHDLLRLLGWLALALVALKSYLYVLALDVFHHERGLPFGLDATHAIEGEIRAARQLTIDRAFPHALITRKQLSNADNRVRIAPWPLSAPLARLLRGCYFFFHHCTFLADAERPSRGMVASASGGRSIVEWRLQPGEEVVFGYRDFFGASENVRLHTEISLRLSTLLLGHIFFRIARCDDGEGRLLLRAHVEELDPEHIRAIPPERLLAWHRHARFGIHSGRTVWSTLVNGYTLVRKPGRDGAEGQVVVSSEDLGSGFGSLRFVRRIFSALF